MAASRHFQQHQRAPHLMTYFSPSAEKTFCPTVARRETYSSPSHQSSLRSHSSRYTSDRHRPSTRGYCSGKPGIPEGCGASHLQGRTHGTRAQLHRAQMHRLKRGWQLPKAAVMGGRLVLPPAVSGHERRCRWGSCGWRGKGMLVAEPEAESGCPRLLL